MIGALYSAPVFFALVAIAMISLVLVIKLLLQPVFHRLRILKHMENDGARQAALEERVRQQQTTLALIDEVRRAEGEHELVQSVLRAICNALQAQRAVLAYREQTWFGPGEAVTDTDRTMDTELGQRVATERGETARGETVRGETERGETHSSPQPGSGFLMHAVSGAGQRPTAWLGAARSEAFDGEAGAAAAVLAPVVGLAFSRIDEMRRERADRERSEESEETVRRANLVLSRTQQLGLQGELAHHLVRELTGPVTGILGLAQFLATADTQQPEEVAALLEEGMRCRRILEQFAAVSLADSGQQSRELVEVSQVVREVIESTGARFRQAGVVQRSCVPTEALLLHTNPTTFTRLLTDLLLAGLAFAEAGKGEVHLRLTEIDNGLQFDFLATARPEASPDEIPDMMEQDDLEQDLWRDLDTINLAVVQAMCGCLDGRLDVVPGADVLQARLVLASSQAPIPLRAGVLAPYGASTET